MEQKLIKPARENVRVRKPDGAHLSRKGNVSTSALTGCAVKPREMWK
ncbi:hypothetical protein [Escherichia coli]